jgi:hypothetical protein
MDSLGPGTVAIDTPVIALRTIGDYSTPGRVGTLLLSFDLNIVVVKERHLSASMRSRSIRTRGILHLHLSV